MTEFTPIHAIVGGALIALSLSIMLIASGRIAGLSGVIAGVVHPFGDGDHWRAWFVLGMVAAGLVFEVAAPATFDAGGPASLPIVALAGGLVGFGTRLGGGCTSGHGLCGLSRRSLRSLVATGVFFAVAVATATLVGGVSR